MSIPIGVILGVIAFFLGAVAVVLCIYFTLSTPSTPMPTPVPPCPTPTPTPGPSLSTFSTLSGTFDGYNFCASQQFNTCSSVQSGTDSYSCATVLPISPDQSKVTVECHNDPQSALIPGLNGTIIGWESTVPCIHCSL